MTLVCKPIASVSPLVCLALREILQIWQFVNELSTLIFITWLLQMLTQPWVCTKTFKKKAALHPMDESLACLQAAAFAFIQSCQISSVLYLHLGPLNMF